MFILRTGLTRLGGSWGCKVAGGSLEADEETRAGETVERGTEDSREAMKLSSKAILSSTS